MSTQRLDNFVRNLNLLSSKYNSVSEVCRKTGINRQQFARYLTGDNLPSGLNLLKLTEFFGVGLDELFEARDPSVNSSRELKEILPLLDFFTQERCEDFSDGNYRLYFRSLDHEDHVTICACTISTHGRFREFTSRYKRELKTLDDLEGDNVFSHSGWLAGHSDMYHIMSFPDLGRKNISHLAIKRSPFHRNNYFGPYMMNSVFDTNIKVVPAYLEWVSEAGYQDIEETGCLHQDVIKLSPWLRDYLFSFNIVNHYKPATNLKGSSKLRAFS